MSRQVTCFSCGGSSLQTILSLGETPLANSLRSEAELDLPEPKFPLDLAFCNDCSLVQITETVPPEALFSEYLYFSSFSDTMLNHARDLSDQVIRTRHLHRESLVVEVASNDGYLLQYYKERGVGVLGVEPAANIAQVARDERGIPTRCAFFGRELARELVEAGIRADVMHAHNVLAHVPDLNGFVAGFELALKEDGVAIIEVPYVRDMIDRCEFDTIYHEHLCYFSATALEPLFQRNGLMMIDIERVKIHGGSLRVTVARSGYRAFAHPAGLERVSALLAEEKSWGVSDLTYYSTFAQKVRELRAGLRELLHELQSQGKRVAAYGAAAKGSTLLNYCGIGREALEFVADRSTHKQGRFMPGSALRITSTDEVLESMPDYLLILAWNFADEIMAQQSEFRRRGGQFILPVPYAKVA